MSAVCLFFALRLFEPMQDIYFGKISSNKEVFQITIKFILLFTFALFGFVVAFSTFENQFDHVTIREILLFGLMPLAIIPIMLIGATWSYFVAGRYRGWLYPRLQEHRSNGSSSKDTNQQSKQ